MCRSTSRFSRLHVCVECFIGLHVNINEPENIMHHTCVVCWYEIFFGCPVATHGHKPSNFEKDERIGSSLFPIPSARGPRTAAEGAGVLCQRPYFVGAGRQEGLVLVVVRPHPATRLLEEGTILEGVANGGPIPILAPGRHPSRHLVKEEKNTMYHRFRRNERPVNNMKL